MKTDRLVNKLNQRIEERYPLEIKQQEASQEEGISIWKGKRILPVDQWLKMIASLENDKVVFDLSKGFDCFPDSTTEVVFQYNVEGSEEYYKEIPKETFDNWFNDYLGLLSFKKNTEFGSMMCKNCLLSPNKDRSGLLIGVHKIVAKTLQIELEANTATYNDHNQLSKYPGKNENGPIYPCSVLDYFSCPYGCKGKVKDKKFEHNFDSDIEYLFELEQITHLVDISLLKASSMTTSNNSIYEIDIESNTIKEIRTLYNGKRCVIMRWSTKEEGTKRILDKSILAVKNKEDILDILSDKEKLDKIIEQGLSNEDYKVWRVRILNFFDSINAADLKMDFSYKHVVYENTQKHTCSECGEFANIIYENAERIWLCKKHFDVKVHNQ